jgi:hypothetical protein
MILRNGKPVTIQELESIGMDGRPLKKPSGYQMPQMVRERQPRKTWAENNPKKAAKAAAAREHLRTVAAVLICQRGEVKLSDLAVAAKLPIPGIGLACNRARIRVECRPGRVRVAVEVMEL